MGVVRVLSESKTCRFSFVASSYFVFFEAEFLEQFEEASLGGEGGAAPFPVVGGFTPFGMCSGDDDGVFVDVESDV